MAAAARRAGTVRVVNMLPIVAATPGAASSMNDIARRCLARRCEGLHHIAFQMEDLKVVLVRLASVGAGWFRLRHALAAGSPVERVCRRPVTGRFAPGRVGPLGQRVISVGARPR